MTCADCDDEDAEIYVEHTIARDDLGHHTETLCLSCAVDVAMDRHGFEDREEARRSVLAAISG